MAADPKYGTFYGASYPNNVPVALDFYFSDVDGAMLHFDGGNGSSSTSPEFATFGNPTILTDMSINAGAAGTYAATNIRITVNGQPTPLVLRVKNHLDTLNNRPRISLKLKSGSRLGGIQHA